MLCAVLVGCRDPFPPGFPQGSWDWDGRAIMNFTRVELRGEQYHSYGIQDAFGDDPNVNWFGTTFFPITNFLSVFQMPATFSGRHHSSIVATTNHPTGGSRDRRYNNHLDNGLTMQSMQIQIYHDGNMDNFRESTLNIQIVSGRYRRDDGVFGNLIWTWRRSAYSFSPDAVTILPQEMRLDAGSFGNNIVSTMFTPITTIFDGGFGNPFGNNQTFNPNRPSIDDPSSFRITDSSPNGNTVMTKDNRVLQLFNREDSRLTAMELDQSRMPSILDPGTIAVEAIQLDHNLGVLKVYVTEETFNSMLSR